MSGWNPVPGAGGGDGMALPRISVAAAEESSFLELLGRVIGVVSRTLCSAPVGCDIATRVSLAPCLPYSVILSL